MSDESFTFFSGLMWYLESKNWAREKIATCPHGSQLFDIRMYHSLYFVNLFGAIDHVNDFLSADSEAVMSFQVKINSRAANHDYARELRNSIVHRGLDVAGAAHSDGTTLYVLCPRTVTNRSGNKDYSAPFIYIRELVEDCDASFDPIFAEVLQDLGYFDPAMHRFDRRSEEASIAGSTCMPGWAKALAVNALAELDFENMVEQMALTKIRRMRKSLHLDDE